MPERLLEQLQEQEVRDLFRYLQSERLPERARRSELELDVRTIASPREAA